MAGFKVIKKGDRVIKEYVDVKTGKIAVYEPGIKLEVSDFKGTWYPAKVLEVDHEENEVLVHYDKWSSRFDEWIKTDSNRLRPSSDTNQVKIQFKVGERVEALWSTDGQRYPGMIKAVHPNDYYEVLFDDGIKCKKKVTQIFKSERMTRGRAAAAGVKFSQKRQSKTTSTPLSSTSTPAPDSDETRTPRSHHHQQHPLINRKPSRRDKSADESGSISETSSSNKSDHNIPQSDPNNPEDPTSLSSSEKLGNLVENTQKSPQEHVKSTSIDPNDPAGSSKSHLPDHHPHHHQHHSIFEPVSTELGKRKRAYHDYSLFLKIPKKSPKLVRPSVSDSAERKRRGFRLSKQQKQQTEETNFESGAAGKTPSSGELNKDGISNDAVKSDQQPLPLKRIRKSSMKAIENIAAAPLPSESPKRRGGGGGGGGRRRSAPLMTTDPALENPSGGEPTTVLPVVGSPAVAAAAADLNESGFVDEQGNALTIEQTTDGGWICPVDKCGKHFRKDSLLQMHLKHYHPGANIHFLGKKLNVFEMAIAKARTRTGGSGSNADVINKESSSSSSASSTTTTSLLNFPPPPSSPELFGGPGKNRRRSSPVTATAPGRVNNDDDVVENLAENTMSESNISNPAGTSLLDADAGHEDGRCGDDNDDDHGPKINTNVCVLLEKINLSNINNSNSGGSTGTARSSRVSQRGRVLAPRKWNRIYSDTESGDEDGRAGGSSGEESQLKAAALAAAASSSPSKRRGGGGRLKKSQVGTTTSCLKGRRERSSGRRDMGGPLEDSGRVQDSCGKSAAAGFASGKKLKRFHNNNSNNAKETRSGMGLDRSSNSRAAGTGTSRGGGGGGRRGTNKLSGKTLLCGLKGKKLELICDELLAMDRTKRIRAKARFEDVRVDVINCECGLEEEFGLMMQCELCQAWQHGNCYDIFQVTQLPQYYVCSFCRDPKGLREASKDEWYQEVNTTGRLPRFSFAAPNDPKIEDQIRGSNDLLNCLTTIQSLLRSTQLKISLLQAAEDSPKLVLWSREQEHPVEAVRREQFRSNYRSVLRQLLRHNRKDPRYVARLRQVVAEHVGKSGPADVARVNEAVRNRLNARAWRMIRESGSDGSGRRRKQFEIPPFFPPPAKILYDSEDTQASFTSDTTTSMDSKMVGLDGSKPDGSASPASPSSNSSEQQHQAPNSAGSSGRAPDEEQVEKLKSDLQDKLREGKCALVEQNDKMYVILTKNPAGGANLAKINRLAQKTSICGLDGGVRTEFWGHGQVVDPVRGLEGLSTVRFVDPNCNKNEENSAAAAHRTINFHSIDRLRFCKICKKGLKVNWSRKRFVTDHQLTVNFPVTTSDGDNNDEDEDVKEDEDAEDPGKKSPKTAEPTSEECSTTTTTTTTGILGQTCGTATGGADAGRDDDHEDHDNDDDDDAVKEEDKTKISSDPSEVHVKSQDGGRRSWTTAPAEFSGAPELPSQQPQQQAEVESEVQIASPQIEPPLVPQPPRTQRNSGIDLEIPVHRQITAKTCRSNLHAAIIREQAVLDLHLDMVENKLRELQKAGLTNPQSALAKLKDLEELKNKVRLINDSIEFMRKVGSDTTTTKTTTTTTAAGAASTTLNGAGPGTIMSNNNYNNNNNINNINHNVNNSNTIENEQAHG